MGFPQFSILDLYCFQNYSILQNLLKSRNKVKACCNCLLVIKKYNVDYFFFTLQSGTFISETLRIIIKSQFVPINTKKNISMGDREKENR